VLKEARPRKTPTVKGSTKTFEEEEMSTFSDKVVLLATDGSRESNRAAGMAITLSEKLGSELHVVHVGPMPEEYIDPRLAIPEPEFWNMMRERAEEEAKPKLNEQVQKIREVGGKVSGAHVRIGLPDAEIVGLAEELGAGLVVLGSRGLGPLKRVLMGSVSDSVVHHAHSPVLVVRGNGREKDYVPGRILLALDGSDEAAVATRAAVEIANATGSELHILFVLLTDETLPYPHPYARERWEASIERDKHHAREFVDKQAERIEAEGGKVKDAHLVFGRPDQEIVKLGEELDAGLIVVGSRGLGGIRRALMGSVSSSVVRHAHGPVLVVRKDSHQDTAVEVGEERERSLER
jgi:nucleotide-binding universal stress UspA family protein